MSSTNIYFHCMHKIYKWPPIMEEKSSHEECKELAQSLPKEKGWRTTSVYQYQGFWYTFDELHGLITFQKHFHAGNSDIILVTNPKSGATWLKALVYSIVNRNQHTRDSNPLLTTNPHVLVPIFELEVYGNGRNPDLSKLESPRIFSTHTPCTSLPGSIMDSDCKLVHLCRNPKDVCVSFWPFLNKMREEGVEPLEFEEAFEMFCKGVSEFGPFWDHVLGYWKLSLERPDKVLFLKYEDLKEDTCSHVKKLAEFLGGPFTAKEEEEGVVEEIISLCSFQNLSNLEVNKTGKLRPGVSLDNSVFFRKGEVGDWKNYFTDEMVEQIDRITKEKLNGSGLML